MNDYICFSLTLNMYKVTGQFPWSSLKETDRGMSAEVNVRRCMCVYDSPYNMFDSELKVSLYLCSCSSPSG